MDGHIVYNNHQVWLWEWVHVVKECINKAIELKGGVGGILNCKVQNPIKQYCRKDGVPENE